MLEAIQLKESGVLPQFFNIEKNIHNLKEDEGENKLKFVMNGTMARKGRSYKYGTKR